MSPLTPARDAISSRSARRPSERTLNEATVPVVLAAGAQTAFWLAYYFLTDSCFCSAADGPDPNMMSDLAVLVVRVTAFPGTALPPPLVLYHLPLSVFNFVAWALALIAFVRLMQALNPSVGRVKL